MASPGCRATSSITDLTQDGRAARQGSAFLALRGSAEHGLKYAPQAVANGARAVLWEPAPVAVIPDLPSEILVAPVPRLREHASTIADRFFGAPSSRLAVAGITGTNGKTTCAYLLAQALEAAGRPAGYMGTIGTGRPQRLTASALTTGDAVTVQRTLEQLRREGAANVAMEVSSHALDQARVGAVRFHTAVFTNLTRDHLDYHGTMDSYGAAKARLFAREDLVSRVINVDDAFGRQLALDPRGRGRVVVTSRGHQSRTRSAAGFVRAMQVKLSTRGIELEFDSSWGTGALVCPLVGDFNVDNLLTVIAVLLDWDIALEQVIESLARVRAAPGRMETFGGVHAPLAVVDYAHTPDALRKALLAARAHCVGRLAVVFGCGGDRDPGKRPIMGAIAAELADDIVITDDNPRGESPPAIAADIAAGIPAGKPFRIELDRALRDSRSAERRDACGRRADRRKGARGLPDLRHGTPRLQRSESRLGHTCHARGRYGMNRTLLEFAQSCGGTLRGADRAYTGVSTDTRTLKAGELFVALRGPRFNANDFVAAAEAAGAAGAVVDSPVERPLAQVVVPDTQAALTTSAAAWRAQFSMPIVGVAGSNGKTTVKEMTAAILERSGNTLATRGNLNNHIGVPLTLHRLDGTHRYAVVEIGANRAGEVADLVKLARPTVGPHHQRRSRASRGLRQHGGCRARRGRNGGGTRRLRHRGDQCRRRLRRPVAQHGARPDLDVRSGAACGFFGDRHAHRDRPHWFRHAFHAACAGRRDAHRAAPGGRAQRPQRAVRGGGGHRRGRLARRRPRRPCHNAPGSWPIAVQNRAEWRLDCRRFL